MVPLAVSGEDGCVHLWCRWAVVVSITQCGARLSGKGSWWEDCYCKVGQFGLAPCTDYAVHILSLDCECSYKVIYIFAFC